MVIRPRPSALSHNQRGAHGELKSSEASTILVYYEGALPARYAEFDNAGRGDSVSHDLYAYDAETGLAIVQVRHYYKVSRKGYPTVRKTYFLVGYTESGNPFRHPVGSHKVRAAIRQAPDDHQAIIRAVQCWIFQCTEKKLAAGVRQGDVLLFPATRAPRADIDNVGTRLSIGEGSHELRAEEIRICEGGKIYAFDPSLHHLKGQHDPVYATTVDRWWIVRLGREHPTHDFAARLGD